jgi:hypothetical protein
MYTREVIINTHLCVRKFYSVTRQPAGAMHGTMHDQLRMVPLPTCRRPTRKALGDHRLQRLAASCCPNHICSAYKSTLGSANARTQSTRVVDGADTNSSCSSRSPSRGVRRIQNRHRVESRDWLRTRAVICARAERARAHTQASGPGLQHVIVRHSNKWWLR